MTELETKIKNFADNYYQGNELISDAEYDALIEQLKREQPDSELLNDVVGSDLKGIDKKYKLPITMGTLAKNMTNSEFESWWSKHAATTDVVCSLKVDGNGVLLEYKNGKFNFAYSRGNSEYGLDLTSKVKKMKGFIDEIPNFSGYIRGEAVLRQKDYEEHFSDKKNGRNAAAGILGRKDDEGSEHLSLIVYDVFDDNNVVDKTEIDKLNFLDSHGFEVPLWWAGVQCADVIEFKDNLKDYIKQVGYACDGIVIKQNKVSKEDLMRHTPLENCALKPNREIEITTVKKIIWQLGGRYFSPVVTVEPVELCGTTVKRASVANVNIMNELGIYEGAEVEITKGGEIIPKILKVLNPKKNAFAIPTVCPVCGGKVVVNSSGAPECINEVCSKKVAHRYKRLFKVFNIKGAGDSFVSSLEDAGITIEDFLEMCNNSNKEILNKYAGGINGEKIYIQMKNAMKTPITAAQFLATFDVNLFDEKKLNQLGNKSLDEILNLDYNNIVNIDGFAETTATALINFLKNYKDEINSLRNYFVFKETSDNIGEKKMSKITGKSFCFTGKACKPRSELEAIVINNGGSVKNGVVKTLDYLVTDDTESGSSKNKKAKELNIPVITSLEFLEMAN